MLTGYQNCTRKYYCTKMRHWITKLEKICIVRPYNDMNLLKPQATVV